MTFSLHDAVGTSPTNTFATLNVLDTNKPADVSEGNLKAYFSGAGNSNDGIRANFGIRTGIWYWEYIELGLYSVGGVGTSGHQFDTILGYDTDAGDEGWGYSYSGGANKIHNGSITNGYGSAHTTNDIIGVLVDMGTGSQYGSGSGTITFYKNGTSMGVAFSNLYGTVFPMWADNSNGTNIIANFGQDHLFGGATLPSGAGSNTPDNGIGTFAFSVPSGAKALCTANIQSDLAIDPNKDDVPEDFFNCVLYTGNGSSQSITNVGFQPDLVFLKERSSTSGGNIYDTVRGAQKILFTNSTNAEATYSTVLTSFDSDGFSAGGDGATNQLNQTYVAWCWKAGGSGASSGNANLIDTDGTSSTPTISSIVSDALGTTNGTQNTNPGEDTANHMYTPSAMSINRQSGLSILTYEGHANTTYRRIPHGLNKKPDFAIFKQLTDSGYSWRVYHKSIGATHSLQLESTNAAADRHYDWNDTEPTNKYFTVNTDGALQQDNKNFVAYIWTEIPGFSAFGSYSGNESTDGTFVFTGHKPALVFLKRYSSTVSFGSWCIFDNAREPNNEMNTPLYANKSIQEGYRGDASTSSTNIKIDFLSNGFKLKSSMTEHNVAGDYVYASFSEMPFKYAATNAR